MTKEWLSEAALLAADHYESANIITEKCFYEEQMNEKLRDEIIFLEAKNKEICSLNLIELEKVLKLQKINDENNCEKERANNVKINSLTTQLDKINQLYEMKINENKDVECTIITQLELYQSTIKVIKNDSLNLRSNIKQLETKLSIITTKCIKNKKSFLDALSSIKNENNTTFLKLKKIIENSNDVMNASKLRAEEEIIKSMYLTRENMNMKLELFEYRRKEEMNIDY